MAKATKNVEVKLDVKTIATQKNREKRLAKHAKLHPNDEQSVREFKGVVRQKPKTKGNFPAEKTRLYDGSGKFLGNFESDAKYAKPEEIWVTTRRIQDEEKRAAKENSHDKGKEKSRKTKQPRSKA